MKLKRAEKMGKAVFALIKYKPNEIIEVFPSGKIVYESQEIDQTYVYASFDKNE